MREIIKIILFIIFIVAIFWIAYIYITWVSNSDLPFWLKISLLS